eukprot:tig00020952_g16482.t1
MPPQEPVTSVATLHWQKLEYDWHADSDVAEPQGVPEDDPYEPEDDALQLEVVETDVAVSEHPLFQHALPVPLARVTADRVPTVVHVDSPSLSKHVPDAGVQVQPELLQELSDDAKVQDDPPDPEHVPVPEDFHTQAVLALHDDSEVIEPHWGFGIELARLPHATAARILMESLSSAEMRRTKE